jgi:hypothetical protein
MRQKVGASGGSRGRMRRESGGSGEWQRNRLLPPLHGKALEGPVLYRMKNHGFWFFKFMTSGIA